MKWQEWEIDLLKQEYSKEYLNLNSLAMKLKRNKTNVSRKARQLGLKTLYKRKRCPEIVEKNFTKYPEKYGFIKLNYGKLSNEDLSKITGYSVSGLEKIANVYGFKKPIAEVWTRNKHPKGFLGKKRSEKEKENTSKRVKKMWQDPNSKVNSREFRDKRSESASKMMIERIRKSPNSIYSNSVKGKRRDLGIFLRSKWEANYARYLNFLVKCKQIKQWEYETDTFYFENIKRGCRSYTPDFKITLNDGNIEFHEVKGWMDDKSKTKLKRMEKYYPEINIILIMANEYNAIKKQFSKAFPNWE